VLFINGPLGAQSIRFGTDDNALTMIQQSLIRVNGQKARLDASGYLKTITERTDSGFQVVGFSRISDQWGTPVVDDMSYYAPLTELIYASVKPIAATGAIDSSSLTNAVLNHLMAAKKAQEGMPVRLSVGGNWVDGHFNFVDTPSLRATFIQNLLELVLANGFDGVDYDWEYPTYQPDYRDFYDELINETKTAFAPYGLDVTLDTNSWADSVNNAYAAADRVHDMTYFDLVGTRHSLLRYEDERGVPRTKLALGVPFYARNFADKSDERKYRGIVTATDIVVKPVEPWNNFFTKTSEPGTLYFFNNLELMKLQTRMLMDYGAQGIMIWDLLSDYWEGTHPDYPGVPDLSLLNAIGEAKAAWTPSNEKTYNGGFDVMLEAWELAVDGGSTADVSVTHDTTSALNGQFSARVEVTTAGAASADARFSQAFEVSADQAYRIDFVVRSAAGSGTLPVRILDYESHFVQYGATLEESTVPYNTSAATHTFYFFPGADGIVRLSFELGTLPAGTTLYLDDAVATEMSPDQAQAEDWRLSNFGTPDNSGNAADDFDFDADGSANLLERAFGTLPTDNGSVFNPVISNMSEEEALYPAITYRRLSGGIGTTGIDYTVDGLTYTVEHDTDLIPEWGTGAVTAVGAPVPINSEVEEVTVRSNQAIDSGNPRQFLRLSVSGP